MEEYNRLPISFSEGPHNYLEFLRRWGRFVVRGANWQTRPNSWVRPILGEMHDPDLIGLLYVFPPCY